MFWKKRSEYLNYSRDRLAAKVGKNPPGDVTLFTIVSKCLTQETRRICVLWFLLIRNRYRFYHRVADMVGLKANSLLYVAFNWSLCSSKINGVLGLSINKTIFIHWNVSSSRVTVRSFALKTRFIVDSGWLWSVIIWQARCPLQYMLIVHIEVLLR